MFIHRTSGFFSVLPTALVLPFFTNEMNEKCHYQQRISKVNYFLHPKSRLFCECYNIRVSHGVISYSNPYFAQKPKVFAKHIHQQQRENESFK